VLRRGRRIAILIHRDQRLEPIWTYGIAFLADIWRDDRLEVNKTTAAGANPDDPEAYGRKSFRTGNRSPKIAGGRETRRRGSFRLTSST
jgi:hypothetical protein